jgi:hypothetical protein
LTLNELSGSTWPALDTGTAGCGIFWPRLGVVLLRIPPNLGSESIGTHYALDQTTLQS